jgi:hypothetical protein
VVQAWRAGDRAALDHAIATLASTGVAIDRALADDWRERQAARWSPRGGSPARLTLTAR